jgi:integrase
MPRGSAVVRYDGKRGTVWRIKYADADGKQVMETVGAERDGWTQTKAEAELRERLVRVERKGYRRPGRMTFGPYARTWLAQAEKRRGWKPSTRKTRRLQVARLGEWFETHALGAIKPRHVAEYVDERLTEGYAPATIGGDLDVFYEVMKTAKREELIDSNPVEGVERPKIKRRKWRILEPIEVARVRKAFTEQQPRVAFLTLVLTGLRRFELQALRWRDVDLVENVLRVLDSKTEEGVRSIAIPPGLAEELWQWRRTTNYRGDDERAFSNQKTGGAYREEHFADSFRAALAAAGITEYVRPFHDLRHTAITNDAASGSSAIAVMAKAGHASMATTKRYLHLAGVVFHDEAEALERRLLGVDASIRPGEPERIKDDAEHVSVSVAAE